MALDKPDQLADEEPELIELVNDEGEELVFELLAVVEVDERLFAALTPHDEPTNAEGALDLHIFHYEEFPPDEDSPDGYWSVEPVLDEALEERVFDEVQQLLMTAALED